MRKYILRNVIPNERDDMSTLSSFLSISGSISKWRDLAAGDDSSSPPEDRFNAALAGMGFQPSHERTDGGRVTFCLNNCPYRDTVKGQQAVICGLHRGISAGLLESIAPEARLERFAPKDPEEAGCQIEVSGLPTDSAG